MVSCREFKFSWLFKRNVGLIAKFVMANVSENVEEDDPLSKTRVGMTNTKNKTRVECVTKNNKRLIHDQPIRNPLQSCKQDL